MNLHIHIHHHGKHQDDEVLHNIFTLTQSIHSKLNEMTPELQRLTDEITEMKTVNQSAIALLQNLSQLIRDNANDPAALTALADELDSENKKLADAVTANTPAQPGNGDNTGSATGQPAGGEGNPGMNL
jgi:DNA repair ATPase RecN